MKGSVFFDNRIKHGQLHCFPCPGGGIRSGGVRTNNGGTSLHKIYGNLFTCSIYAIVPDSGYVVSGVLCLHANLLDKGPVESINCYKLYRTTVACRIYIAFNNLFERELHQCHLDCEVIRLQMTLVYALTITNYNNLRRENVHQCMLQKFNSSCIISAAMRFFSETWSTSFQQWQLLKSTGLFKILYLSLLVRTAVN